LQGRPTRPPRAANRYQPRSRDAEGSAVSSCEDAERVAGTVVAAAVLHQGRVLAQQRAYPRATAGRWELPGGRVEQEESVREALVRECREELAVEIVPGERLGPDVPLPGGFLLRVYAARLADPTAQPVPVEHTALRWVDVAELTDLDWLAADRAVLPHLEALLQATAPR
ncbi:MAG: (deoxy)nucleoside triphosphate pyrophosphohydrolase, partial [Pseudonocardiaceae bacterium]